MPRSQFDTLADILLRGGIAPRHVRRYMNELKDHCDDLVDAARKAGTPTADAEREALARIGAPEELAKAMLSRDDLKSVAARHPALVFGFGPVLALAAGLGVFILGVMAVIMSFRPEGQLHSVVPDNWRTIAEGWVFAANCILPIAVAALIAKIGLEQRVERHWILIGVGLACCLGGFMDLNIEWPASVGAPGELNFGMGLAPPFPQFGQGWMRAMINILIVGLPTLMLLRRQDQRA